MPSLFKMTDAKETASEMPVVITQMAAPKPRNNRKIAIIAISAVVAVAVILTAILVGMYMFTKAQKDIIEYAMTVDKDTKEAMKTDQNENVIQYHVQNTNYEMWVVDDFNRDIQVMKIQTKTETNCYVVPLNKTMAADPSKVKTPSTIEVKKNFTESLSYDVSSTPIKDTSFLGKTAKETCKGISVYWMYPKCSDDSNAVERQKRYYLYYCYYYYYYCIYNGRYALCYRYLCYYRWY